MVFRELDTDITSSRSEWLEIVGPQLKCNTINLDLLHNDSKSYCTAGVTRAVLKNWSEMGLILVQWNIVHIMNCVNTMFK